MDFPIDETDELLRTTRAVRRRLDLDRPVSDQVLLDCIDLAEQAPTGGNQGSRRWLVIRRPKIKQALADIYFEAGGRFMVDAAEQLAGTGHHNEKTMASAAFLAEHLADVPAIVIPTIWGEHDGSGNPGLFDSVVQSAWSFCLALRSRGLGTAWTTIHLQKKGEVAEVLGIPDGVTQIVLFPVAYTVGTEFKAAPRRPAREVTFFDSWGFTNNETADGAQTLATEPGISVEIDIEARPEKVWPVITDINVPGQFSTEFQSAEWLDEPGPGARFLGRNHLDHMGDWETTSFVVDWEPNRRFAWAVVDPDEPGSWWAFELEPLAGKTRLRQTWRIGAGMSGLRVAVDRDPDKEAAMVWNRRKDHRDNMTRVITGIKAIVESG